MMVVMMIESHLSAIPGPALPLVHYQGSGRSLGGGSITIHAAGKERSWPPYIA